MIYHLFGLDQAEAEASVAHHGDPPCGIEPCGNSAAVALFVKPPSAAWGQRIKATAACAEHRTSLDRVVEMMSTAAGLAHSPTTIEPR